MDAVSRTVLEGRGAFSVRLTRPSKSVHFVKLKLANCAPISGWLESALYRVKVGHIETRLSSNRAGFIWIDRD
jgi:hypothetical protein